jgi:transposase
VTRELLEARLTQAERDIALRDAQIRVYEKLLAQLAAKLELKLPDVVQLELESPKTPQAAPLFDPLQAPPVPPSEGESPATSDSDAASNDTSAPPKKPRKGHGRKSQDKLRTETITGLLDDADMVCPCCSKTLMPIAGQVEASEVIDVRPREFVLVRVERQKYRCGCGHIETALAPEDAPERAVEGGRYSLEVAAEVVIDKYADHMPLARQTRIMERLGLSVTSQSLWDLVWAMATLLEPAAQAVKKAILAGPALGIDTTSWKNLSSKTANPFQLWCIRAPKAAFFDVRRDKSATSFKILIGEFAGWISADMAGTNTAGVTISQVTRLTGCWSHVFRKFREAAKNHPTADAMCQLIGRLFEIEAMPFTSADERLAARRSMAKPVLAQIKAKLDAHKSAGTVTSLDKAMRYLANAWPYMVRYTDSADAWICNNPTERGLRGPVIGRRNHFGSKSDRGRQAAGTLYTLVETAKLVGVDPAVYLVAAAKAARRGEVLTPEAFAAASSAS